MKYLFRFFRKKRSGAIAKRRLKTILISDRSDCSSALIDAIKEEIGQALSRYIEADMKQIKLDIIVSKENDSHVSPMFLVAKIPFRGINKVIC